MSPEERRKHIKDHAIALARAAQTNDALVIKAMEASFDGMLGRLIPDEAMEDAETKTVPTKVT